MFSKYNLKSKDIKRLYKKSGRNNQGKITVRHRGGGNIKLFRNIDWNTNNFINKIILNIEYDPNRSSFIARTFNQNLLTSNFYINYIICPLSIKSFDQINFNNFNKNKNVIGNKLKIKYFDIGDFLYNLELYSTKGPQLIKSAGTFGQILQKYSKKKGNALVKLPSGEYRFINRECYAFYGRNSNEFNNKIDWKKAGKSRWMNKRPSVRGVAMNPVDHPHGGGEGKTSGGRPSVSFKGIYTKGIPTRKKKKKKYFIDKK